MRGGCFSQLLVRCGRVSYQPRRRAAARSTSPAPPGARPPNCGGWLFCLGCWWAAAQCGRTTQAPPPATRKRQQEEEAKERARSQGTKYFKILRVLCLLLSRTAVPFATTPANIVGVKANVLLRSRGASTWLAGCFNHR